MSQPLGAQPSATKSSRIRSAWARAQAGTRYRRRIAAAEQRGLTHMVTLPVQPSHCAPWIAANVLGRHAVLHNPVAEVTTYCFAEEREASGFKIVFC